MQRIPEELVSEVLRYLSASDLRNVASVDRRLYRAAQDVGCLILRTVDLATPETLSTFQEIVAYAVGKDPRDRPGLGLRLFVNCSAATRSAFESHFQLALNAIQASISLLVHLEAYVPSFFAGDLHATLRSGPAPLLRILALGQACHGPSLAVALPRDLFKNAAPHLRTVSLVLPNFEAQSEPVAVFARVRTAQITLYRTNLPVRVARLLPQVQSLVVDLAANLKPHPGTRPELDLSGLTLRRLTLDAGLVREGYECTLAGIDIARVPVFECGSGTAFTARFWETAPPPSSEPLSLRATCAKFMHPGSPARAIALESAGRTRTAFDDALCRSPIDGAHGVGARLTVIMLDAPFVEDLLRVRTPLLALAELYVNLMGLSSLDPAPGAVSARYPALRVVTLFDGEKACREKPLALHAHNVADFGLMLGLDAQPAAVRLRMVRLAFVQPMPRKRLESVFPVVVFVDKLDLQGLRLAEPRETRVERPFFVPSFIVRGA